VVAFSGLAALSGAGSTRRRRGRRYPPGDVRATLVRDSLAGATPLPLPATDGSEEQAEQQQPPPEAEENTDLRGMEDAATAPEPPNEPAGKGLSQTRRDVVAATIDSRMRVSLEKLGRWVGSDSWTEVKKARFGVVHGGRAQPTHKRPSLSFPPSSLLPPFYSILCAT